MTKSSNTNYPNTSQKESHQSGIHTSLVSPKSITRHGHNRKVGKSPGRKKRIKVVIASGLHLYPYRTEKLNLITPMVLRKRESRSPPSYFQVEALPARLLGGLFVSLYRVNAALFHRPNAASFRRDNAALFRCPNAALFRRVRCCKQPKVAASTTPA